jgi:hyperosmotically inducible protein
MKITSYLSALLLVMVGMLAIGCASTPTQESTGEYVSDTWITSKVKAALVGDSVVNSTEVNVETFKGVVQLSGFVSSQDAMDQALIVAGEIKGVSSVENGMKIK